MQTTELEHYFSDSTPLQDSGEEAEVLLNLAGYQVTRGELFSHSREPSVTIWQDKVKFNMACLRRFPGVTHIQLLIHPEQKRLIIRPCKPEAPDSLRWCRGGGANDITNRDMLCKIFAAKVFDLMNWDKQYRYKIMGNLATCDDETLFLFKFSDFEFFQCGKKSKPYLPREWRDYFGIPVEEHENEYKVDLADGYIMTEI